MYLRNGNEEDFNDFLKLHFRCLIGIADRSSSNNNDDVVKAIDKLLSNIDHRLIVFFHDHGDEEEEGEKDNDDVNKTPPTTTKTFSNIFRVDSDFKVEVICPNCPKSVDSTYANKELIWVPERGFDNQLLGSTNICCHPLKGQNLT